MIETSEIEISKELLEKILKVKVLRYKLTEKLLRYDYFKNGVEYTSFSINTYELAHRCKEWANTLPSKKYQLYSGDSSKRIGGSICSIFSGAIEQAEEIKADTEVEAVIKACEWILNRRLEND